MELFLLPVLLLAGLFLTMDGGGDGGSSPDENGGDDTLAGSGTDRIFGGEGDDDLTLNDHATGLGGVGDDTIYAQDDAVGYGFDGNDNLTGADNATIKGGDGDDSLNASGKALAQGGDGHDVLTAQDDALAEGGAGDDGLLGVDNATISGGDGNDQLTAGGEALANAGAGDDGLMLSDNANGDGGAGNDTINASDEAVARGDTGNDVIHHSGTGAAHGGAGDDTLTAGSGLASIYGDAGNDVLHGTGTAELSGGAGDDVLFMDLQRTDAVAQGAVHGTPSTLSGGEGGDDFILTGFPLEINAGSSDDAAFSYSGPVVIDDFDPAVDRLGLVLSQENLNDVNMSVTYSAATNATSIVLSQGRTIDGDFSDVTIAKIELRGVTGFDPADLRLYADETLTPLSLHLQGTAGNDALTSFGHPSGLSVMSGGAGDDTLWLQDGTVSGGDGDDVLSGRGTLMGGGGDDRLDLSGDLVGAINHSQYHFDGQADGGDGDDTLTAYSAVGEDDSYSTSGSMVLKGGAGDDYIVASDIYAIDAGTGDDTVSILSDDTVGRQDVTLGAGNDVVLADVVGASSGNFYGIGAVVADFNPAEDRLAIILEQGPTAPVVTYTWDAVRGGTDVIADDGVRFLIKGVNHLVTPLGVSFYASEAALQAGTAYATA